MKRIITTLAIGISLTACSTNQKTMKMKNSEPTKTQTQLTNEEKAVALIESLETGDPSAVDYIHPTNYKQHNLMVGDGIKGFAQVVQNAPEGGFKAEVIRSFQDGPYVVTHTKYDFFGPKIGFDIFKFENGQIVEHWDNFSDVAKANPSGHTQIDGSTTITDLNKTEENKVLIRDFVQTILINGEYNKLPNFFDGDHYIQHNPMIGDGLSGFGTAMEVMAKQGITMEFEKNHILLGEGNFVLSVTEGTFAGQPTSYYDLFRVENGKIAEHWDTIETIVPEAQRKHNNGKFNF